MAKTIGQYRYKGKSDCMTTIGVEEGSENNDKRGAVREITSYINSNYIDFGFDYPAGFLTTTDYYLYIAIPQDVNYSCTYDIKLYNSTKKNYQFIKSVTVEAGGSSTNVYDVALYQDSNGNVKVAIPTDTSSVTFYEKDKLYYTPSDSSTDEAVYYLGNGTETLPEVFYKYNASKLTASWLSEAADTFKYVRLVFRPFSTGFNQVVVEMERETLDSAIKRLNSENQIEQGRKVDVSKVTVQCAYLMDLVNKISNGTPLSHIGIWGPSGLLMSVNGEEIHVGASNLYELDDILEVTSLGIVAESYDDNFSIDYAY